MIVHRPYKELPADDLGWLRFTAHFGMGSSSGVRYAPLGALFEWGDDQIAPGTGFPMHGHQNMEIITYVREGVLTHKDDMGNEGTIVAGDVQVMSTGTGVRHSEYNLGDAEASIFQIWITPSARGGAPVWGSKPFPKADRSNMFIPLASGFEQDVDALQIRSESRILGAFMTAGRSVTYAVESGRSAYLVLASGTVMIGDITIGKGDGVAIGDAETVTITALTSSELVMADVPNSAG